MASKTDSKRQGLPRFLERFFEGMTRLDVSALQLAGVMLSVLFVRIILEWTLESQKTIETPTALVLFLLYFASVLAGIFFILWVVTRQPPLVVATVVAFFSPLLWIPPVWDFIASGGKGFTLLFVFSPPPLTDALLTACSGCAGVSPGLRVEVLATIVAAVAFVLWATRSWLKAALAAVLIYGFVVFQALWPAYVQGYLHHPYTDVYFTRELLSSYALWIAAAVLIPWHASTPQKQRRLRWVRILHYVGLGSFGALVGFRVWEHAWPGVLLPVSATLASVALAFKAAVDVNDWADAHAEKKSSTSAFPLASVAGFTALGFLLALAAGYPIWTWVALALALSVAYSVPPVRLRRHVVPASVILAACSLAVVAAGFGVGLLDQSQVTELFPPRIVFLVFGFIFLAAPFKDIKDVREDRKAGTFTLASWLPQEKARLVSAAMVASAGLWATWLSGISWLFGLFFAVAAFWAVASNRDSERMEHVVFGLEYVFMALLALHLSGLWVMA